MASRSILDLDPRMQPLAEKWIDECMARAIPIRITCTRRSLAEQAALYAQGRTKPGRIVTWTLRSKHVDGLALDFCIIGKDGKVSWNLKADVNENDMPDYEEAGKIAEACGLVWGGRWKKCPDYPHIEMGVA